jgi:hypothetical protein
MKYALVRACLVISVLPPSAIVQAVPLELDRSRPAAPSERLGVTSESNASWEGWLNHGARGGLPRSPVPPRSPDLGRAREPLSPSVGPGSGLLGPDAGRSPARLRSYGEIDGSGTGGNI